jgi:hypothetical protein
MARKSGWQQFADNFNSTYGAFSKVGKDWEARDIMGEQPEVMTGEDGTQSWKYDGKSYDKEITPEQLRGFQFDRMANSMSKWGDHKGALEMRQKQEDIVATRESNKVQREIRDELIYQKGVGASSNLDAGIASTNAKTTNTQANTNRTNVLLPGEVNKQNVDIADTVSITAARDAKLPGEVEAQALTNTGQGLSNAGKVTQNAASEVDLKTKQDAYAIEKPLNDALIQFGANADNFKSDAEAAEAFLGIYAKHRPDEAMAMRNKYSDGEIKEILNVGQKNSAEIQVIMSDPKKGLPGVVKWIDDHNGINAGAKIVQGKDGMQLVATNQETGEVLEVIASGASEAELRANLEAYTTPGGSAKLAAQMLDQRKLDSEIELNKTKGLKNVAQAGYYDAQAAGEGKGKGDAAYKKAKADFMRSDAYVVATDGKGADEKLQAQGEWEEWYWSAGPGAANNNSGLGNSNGLPPGVTVKQK